MSVYIPPTNTNGQPISPPWAGGGVFVPGMSIPVSAPGFPPSDWIGNFTISRQWFTTQVTLYRAADLEDNAGGRMIGTPAQWTVLFQNIMCFMVLQSANEGNPEDEGHQVLEQVARYLFVTDQAVTQGTNAIRDSDLIGIGPVGNPSRTLTITEWEQWPELNPTFFKFTGQEIRP